MRYLKLALVLFLLAAFPPIAHADEDLKPQQVEITASDGLKLIGDFYASADAQAPAILLLHMLSSNRKAWEPLISGLVAENYNVLAIDLRGHGDTGGKQDWQLALTDVDTTIAWLQMQASVQKDALAIIGASIGSNLAVMGCANNSACVTAIALSPGLDIRGLRPEESVVKGMADRSVLLIATHGDSEFADAVKQMVSKADRAEISAQILPGNLHGTSLFVLTRSRERIIATTLHWLSQHLPQ